MKQPERSGDGHVKPADRLPVLIRAEYAERVNFAMQQNGVALVERIALTNDGEGTINGLTLSICLGNDECEPWSRRIERIDPGGSFHIDPDGPSLDPRLLASRTEAQRTALHVSVEAEAGSAAVSLPIDLLAFDQWPGVGLYPELLAAFVTPNHPKVAELLQVARRSLMGLSGHDALDGYQSSNRQRAAQIAEACFNAVLTRGIGYINPPASFDRDGQRVRLVDRICREGFGSCLDLSLLLASMWEQAGLHPLILLLEGHAMPAVWTCESHLPEPAIDEAPRVRNLIELGDVVPVESTLLTHRGATFAAAVESAKRRMDSPGAGFCAVDVRSGRKRGVRPLPLRVDGSESGIDADLLEADGVPAPAGTVLDRVALADRLGDGAAGDPPVAERGPDRIERWKRQLLDLSLRNRLVNFRETGRTARLMVPDAARFEDMLAGGDRFTINHSTEGDEQYRRHQLAERHVYTDLPPAETQKRLLQLFRIARSSVEETGANLLYLALGMLRWFETSASDMPRFAPLILLPAQLNRRSAGSGYRYEVTLTDEPPRPNITLLEKLKKEYGIETASLAELPEDESGIDVPRIFHAFRTAIRDTRWEVEESVFIGLFSFNKFLMWRDLQELDRLRENRLVKHLVDQEQGVFDPIPLPRPEDLDDQVPSGELLCTRDADSSQLAAIRGAADGRTFVLEGPPGTGKSQTIANIIADSLGRRKRVLFVAEKLAALSVVRRRLDEDGLSRFCLELHSAKASKKEVLRQLEEALNAPDAAYPPDWEKLCAELDLTRSQLNTYIRELHEPRETGEALYQVLGRLVRLGDGPRVGLRPEAVAAATREQLAGWRRQVALLVERSGPVDPPHQHPLRGIGRSDWSFGLADEARTALADASGSARDLRERLAGFLAAIGAGPDRSAVLGRDGVQALAAAAGLLLQSCAPHPRLLSGPDAPALVEDLRKLIERGKQRDVKREALLSRYRPEFLELEHVGHLDRLRRAAAHPPVIRWISGLLARRKLRAYSAGRLPDLGTLANDIETALEVRRTTAALKAAPEAGELFGRRWKEGHADWPQLEGVLAWSGQFQRMAEVLGRDAAGRDLLPLLISAACDGRATDAAGPAARGLVHAWKDWSRKWGAVKGLLVTSGSHAFGAGTIGGWIGQVQEVLQRWSAAIPQLNDWCAWRAARLEATQSGIGDLVERYETGDLPRDHLADAFERGFGTAWFNAIANQVPAIRRFNEASHSKTIARFRTIDQLLINRTREVVGARLGAGVPAAAAPASARSEVGILRRELEKKSRHLPTRRLLELTPNLLARLKPCFLMSPLSVAQYLDPKLPPFDLVVFDEASQIPVWDAIGAIARGAEVIVVGDSKQLPPTSFFDTIDSEQELEVENLAIDDMESILKECNASGIPALGLNWHYRSRHESLIAFSNHHYYENRLHTFPSPQERSGDLGVTLRYVEDGVYDRGASRTNRREAQQVVDEVVRLLSASDSPDSIGIVTFNQAQQSLIEDLLDERRRADPRLDRFFATEVDEPVFVKNLENVQGDERDTIIFSIGFGPDETGRPSMNFGPINQDGGERRLNVAITRARRRLMVFSSLRGDQIDLRRTGALGVRHLKNFLEYAERGPRAIAEAMQLTGSRDFEAGFEQAVGHALTQHGLEVDTQVGCAGYRVDLAVRDPDRPGTYLLGIECDGAAYHSGKTARDRDRLRQSVLEGLGWRIERIWSTQWRINPEQCITGILEAVEKVRNAAAEPAADSLAETGEPDAPEAPGGADAPEPPDAGPQDGDAAGSTPSLPTVGAEPPEPAAPGPPPVPAPPAMPTYRRATPGPAFGVVDLLDPSSTNAAVAALEKIVRAEGPIVEELALRRLAEWCGVKRIGKRHRSRLEAILARAAEARRIKSAGDSLWAIDADPAGFAGFRVAGGDEDQRDIGHIPLLERTNALVQVLEEQFGLPREELKREAARRLGAKKLTKRVKEAMAEALESAITAGRAESADDRVTLPQR